MHLAVYDNERPEPMSHHYRFEPRVAVLILSVTKEHDDGAL
jgi:hypothetical protein